LAISCFRAWHDLGGEHAKKWGRRGVLIKGKGKNAPRKKEKEDMPPPKKPEMGNEEKSDKSYRPLRGSSMCAKTRQVTS